MSKPSSFLSFHVPLLSTHLLLLSFPLILVLFSNVCVSSLSWSLLSNITSTSLNSSNSSSSFTVLFQLFFRSPPVSSALYPQILLSPPRFSLLPLPNLNCPPSTFLPLPITAPFLQFLFTFPSIFQLNFLHSPPASSTFTSCFLFTFHIFLLHQFMSLSSLLSLTSHSFFFKNTFASFYKLHSLPLSCSDFLSPFPYHPFPLIVSPACFVTSPHSTPSSSYLLLLLPPPPEGGVLPFTSLLFSHLFALLHHIHCYHGHYLHSLPPFISSFEYTVSPIK